MSPRYLKKAAPRPASEATHLRDQVQIMLANISYNGEAEALRYSETLDRWTGDVLMSDADRAAMCARIPEDQKAAILFAHDNIRRFADAQRATLIDCTVELLPGHWAGQRSIPVGCAGCYVPGGRYAHIASALMTITTAKAAGVQHIVAASPPRSGHGIHDAVVYAMDLAGADHILNMGGVQAVAAMADGLFGLPAADIIVGPGNAYVAEAKRQLFGRIGIDMLAGPTDSMVLADATADAETIAWDLVGQAEHGYNSPVWLASTDETLARRVLEIVPDLIEQLPPANADNARAAWTDYGEVMVCASREEMAATADAYAPEHLHVQAAEPDWWLDRLTCYGSLFLGAETTVAFGDKCSGPNHVLPTSGAARYTGGLSVHKFLKTVTWQRTNVEAARRLGVTAAQISRIEGMEGHACTADLRSLAPSHHASFDEN